MIQQYNTPFSSTTLHSAVQHSISAVQHSIQQYSTPFSSTTLHSAVQHSIQQYNTPFSSTTLHISSTTLHISSTTLHISLLTDCNNPIRLGDRDTYPIQGTCYRGKPDISETVVMERLNQTGKKERFFKSLVNYHMI